MYELSSAPYNGPTTGAQIAEFQIEIRSAYRKLCGELALYGEEGDYYGQSDFSIRPDLRERRTFSPPDAPPSRQFVVVVLSKHFFESEFLKAILIFLRRYPGYRIEVSQDFDPDWILDIFMSAVEANVFCSDERRQRIIIERIRNQLSGRKLRS